MTMTFNLSLPSNGWIDVRLRMIIVLGKAWKDAPATDLSWVMSSQCLIKRIGAESTELSDVQMNKQRGRVGHGMRIARDDAQSLSQINVGLSIITWGLQAGVRIGPISSKRTSDVLREWTIDFQFTLAKEVMFYPAFVCLSVFLFVCLLATSRKTNSLVRFSWKSYQRSCVCGELIKYRKSFPSGSGSRFFLKDL